MSDEAPGDKRPSRLEEKAPLQHEALDGKCYMVCCACELPCGALTPLVQFCSYIAVFVMFGGLIGGIVASSAMNGETDPAKCKLDWAPSCLAGKVLIIALCFVSIFVAVWGLYCCCSNCNGEETDHRKGLVTCYKCKAMLFVPPVALHFHCAKCFVPLSLTRDKPREAPDEEKQPKARTTIVGHQVQDVDLSRDIIKAFILKADLNHDGSLTPEELDAYLKSTQGSEDHSRALLAVKTLQGTELVKTSSTDGPISPKKGEEVVLDVNTSPMEDANNPTINNFTVGASAAAAETSPALTPSAATS